MGMESEKFGGIPAYVGEVKDQLRDGFGIYKYPNKFFRYEGEWKEGKKHGHGKLFMSDGSYYEGQFHNGEISGTGNRKWAHNNNVLRGSFDQGELCGHGKMTYGDGSKYDGDWQGNLREGNGEYTSGDGLVYKGEFYKNKRHGHGSQVYSNDEMYEGEWVNDGRQGHGVMSYKNDSIYSGQWQLDLRNGFGSLISSSGASYEGQWINDQPELEASKLSMTDDDYIEIERGMPFDVNVECRTAEDELCPDNGRQLQVTAGIRIGSQSKLQKMTMDDDLSDLSKITTPFGFDVYPYPIIDTKTAQSEQESAVTKENTKENTSNETTKESIDFDLRTDVELKLANGEELDQNEATSPKQVASTTNEDVCSDCLTGDTEEKQPDNTFLLLHATVIEGKVTFSSLVFPNQLNNRLSPESNDGRQTAFRGKRDNSSAGQADIADKNSKTDAKGRKDKRDLKTNKDEKYSRPGDYVVIIRDVTDPPFLDVTLEPAFLHVKVIPSIRKTKSKADGRKD